MSDTRKLSNENWEKIAALAISDQPLEYRENCIAWLRWDRDARIELQHELERRLRANEGNG